MKSERSSEKEQHAPEEGRSTSILRALGKILRESRDLRGPDETLEKAAATLGFEKSGAEGSAKGNLSNIENGNIALPWRRVVKFSRYTKQNSASVTILLALAKALKEIKDPDEQNQLEADIRAAFGITPNEPLSTLTSRLAHKAPLSATRQALRELARRGIWRNLKHLEDICPRLASHPGPYFDMTVDEALFSEDDGKGRKRAPRLIALHAKKISGAELVLLQYLRRFDSAIPVDLDATALTAKYGSPSPNVEQVLESQLSALALDVPPADIIGASGLVLVIRNIPRTDPALRRLNTALRDFFDSHSDARALVIADDHIPTASLTQLPECGGICYTLAPLRESDGEQVLRESCGIDPAQLSDWQLLALRHPLLLASTVTIYEETNTLPDRWKLIRTVAHGLATGSFSVSEGSTGLFPLMNADIKRLTEIAAITLTEGNASLAIATAARNADVGDLSSLLVYDRKGHATSFALASFHYYLAALHFLSPASSTTAPGRLTKLIGDLNLSGNRAAANDLLDALDSEILSRGLAEHVLNGELKRLRKPRTSRSDRAAGPTHVAQSSRKDSHEGLSVLMEDQETARALKRLLNSSLLKQPNIPISLFLADYNSIATYLQDLTSDNSDNSLSFDIVACPHHALAEAVASGKLCAKLSQPLRSKLEGSTVARQYCRQGDFWYGVPFQFPTKFLCRVKDDSEAPAIPYDTWEAFTQFLRESPRKLVLQANPEHQSLYYEWLAFSLAMGGGDVCWSHNAEGGTVILESPETILATKRFLSLIHEDICHPKSKTITWDNLIQFMLENDSAGLSLPFSDTVTELSRGHKQFDFMPFGPFGDAACAPIIQTFGFDSLPRHVLTAHIFVTMNHDPDILERSSQFFEWFLNDRTQELFLKESLHSVWADRFITSARSEGVRGDAMKTAAIAQQYGFFPTHLTSSAKRKTTSSATLSAGQDLVFNALSRLVKNRNTQVDAEFKEVAAQLRKL